MDHETELDEIGISDTPITDAILSERVEFDKQYRDPHVSAEMEAKIVLEILDSCGDNHEKKIKFLVHLLYERNVHLQDLRYQLFQKSS